MATDTISKAAPRNAADRKDHGVGVFCRFIALWNRRITSKDAIGCWCLERELELELGLELGAGRKVRCGERRKRTKELFA
jgi:hypothetical protein